MVEEVATLMSIRNLTCFKHVLLLPSYDVITEWANERASVSFHTTLGLFRSLISKDKYIILGWHSTTLCLYSMSERRYMIRKKMRYHIMWDDYMTLSLVNYLTSNCIVDILQMLASEIQPFFLPNFWISCWWHCHFFSCLSQCREEMWK